MNRIQHRDRHNKYGDHRTHNMNRVTRHNQQPHRHNNGDNRHNHRCNDQTNMPEKYHINANISAIAMGADTAICLNISTPNWSCAMGRPVI